MMMLEWKMSQIQPHIQQQQPGTGLLYNAAGQPVAITLPSQSPGYELYKSKQSVISGTILIVAGVLSIAFNAVGMGLVEALSFIAHGIWCGIMVSDYTV